jgi:RHS repeat-associated protein
MIRNILAILFLLYAPLQSIALTTTYSDSTEVAAAMPCGVDPPTFIYDLGLCDGVGGSDVFATPGASFNTARWYYQQTGGPVAFYTGLSRYFSVATTVWVSSYNTSSSCESVRTMVTIPNGITPPPPIVSSRPACAGPVILTASGSNIRWSTTTGQFLYSGSVYSIPNLQQTTSYLVTSFDNSFSCASSVTITISVVPKPIAPTSENINSTDVYGTGSVTINMAPIEGNNINWYANPTGGSAFFTGTQYTTPVIGSSVRYYVSHYNIAAQCESDRTMVTPGVRDLIPANTTKTEIIRVAGIKQESSIDALTTSQRTDIYDHYDGLLRMVQRNISSASPDGYAIVQPIEYDQFGRTSKSYLPYVSNLSQGSFKGDFKTSQLSFYANTGDQIANDPEPYSKVSYESSTLGRPVEQGNVGSGFQPGTARTDRVHYSFNDGSTNSESDEVQNLNSSGSGVGFYAANKLSRITFTDAQGDIVVTYQDATGKLICVKKQLGELINGATINYLQTYYVYDDFGRIKYIIPPNGTVALRANAWVLSSTILDQSIYQFVYDSRGRVVEKKVPGQAILYFVYDKMDRLILLQDGLLRAQNKWTFLKYDRKGRAIMQGLYLNTTQTTRSTIQSLVDGLYANGNASYPPASFHENRGSTLHGYTNVSFPNGALEVWNVNYYDKYDFNNTGSVDTYTAQGLPNENKPERSFGLPTGSKNLILGTSTYLTSYIFYDQYARPIQVKSNNHLSSAIDNLATTAYDFEGKVLWTKVFHNAGAGKQTTVTNQYTYDHMGRLLDVSQSNNGSTYQLILRHEYNELGQLVDKKMHESTPGNFLQSLDLRYNIQGMLISINNSDLTSDAGVTNDDTNDYFGMEYLYYTMETGLNNTARYDGNISAVKWKGLGMDNDKSYSSAKRSYTYLYDKSDKLKSGTYQALSTAASWNKEVGAFNESTAYDHNGNIKSLLRNNKQQQLTGVIASYGSQVIDNLTYTYSATMGDRLIKVEDATADMKGFANGANVATEYEYDVNGNLTRDYNKAIASNGIIYNLLGKPTQISFTDGRKVEYVYTASGTTISMKTFGAGNIPENTTEYVGQFVYEKNVQTNDILVLSFFGSPGGRVVKNGAAFEYQYNISDHQGNTRVVFTSATLAPENHLATFENPTADTQQGFKNIPNALPYWAPSAGGPAQTKAVQMNQNFKIGPAKSIKVFPGDKIDMEVWTYYTNNSGYGTSSPPLTTLISAVAGSFGGVSGAVGESGAIYNGVNSGLTSFGVGGNRGDTNPAAYLNYILFDKDYKLLDMGWTPATGYNAKQKISIPTRNIKEEGYIFVYLSYEGESNNYVQFDDLKITHTKTNVIQYNEYYPFGLKTSNSWTRTNTKNNFLYNAGSELNITTGWYDLPYRNYDPALGRFIQVDPLAVSEMATYQYVGNNPVRFNDPSGLFATCNCSSITGGSRKYAYGSFGYYWHLDDTAKPGMGSDGHAGGAGGGGLRVAGPSVEELEQKYLWENLMELAPEGTTTYEFDYNSDGEFGYYTSQGISENGVAGVESKFNVISRGTNGNESNQINVSRFSPEMFQFERLGDSNWQVAGITHATIGFIAGLRPVGVVFQLEVGAPIKNRYQQLYSSRLLSVLAAQAANEAAEKIVKNKSLFYNPMSNAIVPAMFAKDMQIILNRKLMSENLIGGGARVNTPIISNLENIIDFLDYLK